MSISQRVSTERGWPLGTVVGYQVYIYYSKFFSSIAWTELLFYFDSYRCLWINKSTRTIPA